MTTLEAGSTEAVYFGHPDAQELIDQYEAEQAAERQRQLEERQARFLSERAIWACIVMDMRPPKPTDTCKL